MTENGIEWLDSDEEAPSLCDLPVAGHLQSKCSSMDGRMVETSDFRFDSWGGSSVFSMEMCAADEVFFEGQILPVRPSVSSDNSYLPGCQPEKENPSMCGESRSDSLERYGSSGFSGSYSRASSSSSSSAFEEKLRNKGGSTSPSLRSYSSRSESRKVYNRFHTYPSPKPQVYFPVTLTGTRRVSFSGGKSSLTTKWGLFRPGLLKTPEIELHDLRLRQKRNGETQEHNNNNSSSTGSGENNNDQGEKKKKKVLLSWRLLSDRLACKCSITALETIPSRIVILKSKQSNNEDKEKIKLELQAKLSISNRRTYEWLKELSTADAPET